MKRYYLLLFTIFLFTACGSSSKKVKDNSPQMEIKELDKNITTQPSPTPITTPNPTTPPKIKETDKNSSTPAPATEATPAPTKKIEKTVTIYVHGYRKTGYKKEQTYGNLYTNTFKRKLIDITDGISFKEYNSEENITNIVTGVEYYGNEAPNYYRQKDVDDVDAISKEYDGGIPRYALIVAKFAKFVLKRTQAKQVNIVSVSMGSLITRWLIEKDVEGLASEGKIAKWMTVEGVIRGNYALSSVENDTLLSMFYEISPDTKQMKYKWIEKNLTPTRSILKSPYYKDILVGQMSLTDGSKSNSLLKYLLPFNGGFKPNDGIQLLRDTYFESVDKNNRQILSHGLIHHDHIDVKSADALFPTIASFLKAKKRVRITLVNMQVNDIHEEINSNNLGSEIVFASQLFSPYAKEKWSTERAVDERLFESGALKVYNYSENGQEYALNQIIFDNFVAKSEKELRLKLQGFEIDSSKLYHIKEINREFKVEDLGESESLIPLKNNFYSVSGSDWECEIKVEVIE